MSAPKLATVRTADELVHDPRPYDGQYVEVIGVWSSHHFETSHFAGLSLVAPPGFRHRTHGDRLFGDLKVRVRGTISADPDGGYGHMGVHRAELIADTIEVLAEIAGGVERPPPVRIDRELYVAIGGVLLLVDHVPFALGDDRIIEREGALVVVSAGRATRVALGEPALDGDVYFTSDRLDPRAWAHVVRSNEARGASPPDALVVLTMGARAGTPVPATGGYLAWDRAEGWCFDDGPERAIARIFPCGKWLGFVSMERDFRAGRSFVAGHILRAESAPTTGGHALRFVTPKLLAKLNRVR